MNGGRADASTSTDDVKGRPLCLFYFTHPFGVLSPEPPTVTAPPPNIARTYVNMEPVPPFWTSSSSPGYDTASTRPSYDLGNANVHRNPVNLVRKYDYDFGRDSMSSSLFSSDMWFSSSASSRRFDERRVVPYNKMLPPLQLPSPKGLPLDFDSSDDIWPKKCVQPGKFSLPPIELPISSVSEDILDDKVPVCDSEFLRRQRRMIGVRKYKRRTQVSSVRRMITCLMQRSVRDNCPPLNNCCLIIPLRTASFIISVTGQFLAALYIFAFTPTGAGILEDLGLHASLIKPLRYIHGVIGVLLSAVHVVLLLAAVFENDALCEVYVWFLVIYWVLVAICGFVVICGGLIGDELLFSCLFMVISIIMILISFYFAMIVANYRMTLP